MADLARRQSLTRSFISRPSPRYGPSFMGGTLSAREARLALRLFLRPETDGLDGVLSDFEREFEAGLGTPHAVAFGKGRVALWAILRALEIGAGDEVIVPGYTCVAVPNAVRFAGAQPVYADIDPVTFNITAASCDKVLTPRARALIVGHTYGLPAPLAELQSLADSRGLVLIEDAAHALGAVYQGRPVGSVGHAAFFSTEHSKVLSTGLGGVATTGDAALAARLRAIQANCPPPDAARVRRLLIPYLAMSLFYRTRRRRLGDLLLYRSRLYRRAEWGTPEIEHLGVEPSGYFWRMGTAQARLGLEQLRRLPELNAARAAITDAFTAALASRGLSLPVPPVEGKDATRPVYVRLPYLARRRDDLLAAAAAEGLELGLWFESPVHPGQTDLTSVGYTPGCCPAAERTCRQIVNLPCHPGVTEADVTRYADLLARVEC